MRSELNEYATSDYQLMMGLESLVKDTRSRDERITALKHVLLVEFVAKEARATLVGQLRADGASWTEIGDWLEMTKQGAWEMYH